MSNFVVGVAVPNPKKPLVCLIRILSILFVPKTISLASVVPKKFSVAPIVEVP